MVDEERVVRILAGITADLDRLETAAANLSLRDEPVRLDAVKYRFVTAIEGSSRIAHHMAASEGWGSPDSSADALRLLADHEVLHEKVATRMAGAAGFRNVLVHQYAEVDDAQVLANLERLDDLRAFVSQIASWITEH